MDMHLLDASGNLLATATAGRENTIIKITDFVAPTNGTYFIQLDAVTTGADYSLVVILNAALDQEKELVESIINS